MFKMGKIVNSFLFKGMKLALVALITITASGLLLPLSAVGEGVGMASSPAKIQIKGALNGDTIQRTIHVQYSGSDDTIVMNLSADGDISDWVIFSIPNDPITPVESILANSGEWASMLVSFHIPEDAPVGVNSGKLYATTSKENDEAEERGVGILVRANWAVGIEVVGTPVLAGLADRFAVNDIETGYPLRVEFYFQNTGNIVATPKVGVEISKDDEVIDSFTMANVSVGRDKKEKISVEWDTEGRATGDYVALVTVYLNDQVINTKTLNVAILPRGTLTRSGSFIELGLDAKPELGIISKVVAKFHNTGQIDTKAQFQGEVHLDEKLINVIQSTELLVPVGEERTLQAYLEIENPGAYKIEGHINYEGKLTATKAISFSILPKGEDSPTMIEAEIPKSNPGSEGNDDSDGLKLWVVFVVIAAAVLIGSAVFLVGKKRGSKA